MGKKLKVVNPRHPFKYSETEVPPSYKCSQCGATGVKLWRDYQTFTDHQTLLCLECACTEQKKVRTPTEDGRSLYTGKVIHYYRTILSEPGWWYGYDPALGTPHDAIETKITKEQTSEIGWRVPAVPTEENDTFWGYTSIPQEGCEWWYKLPTIKATTISTN